MRRPVTPGGDVLVLNEAAGPWEKPADVAAANVYPLASIVSQIDREKPDVDEVDELWQLVATFDGPTTPELEDVWVILWCLSRFSGLWQPTAPIHFVGDDLILTEKVGQVFHMPGVMGTTHVGVAITGQGAGNNLNWLHQRR
jgi:hypothetical protein